MEAENIYQEKKEKGKDWCQNLKLYFREYCQNTSIHGFKYVSENQKRLYCERIWWMFSILISLTLCIVLIMKTYAKWENSPVIVSFATKETPIWQIPFPAVTICPETKSVPRKFNYKSFLDMKEKNQTINSTEESKFGLLSLLCKYNENINIENNFDGTPEEMQNFYEEIQPDFFNIISDCKFMRKGVDCEDIFTPIFTDNGICYTFNMLDRNDLYRENVIHYKKFQVAPSTNWSIEYGYPVSDGRYTYPRRSLFAGAVFALEAKLTVYDEDLDDFCGSAVQGYKLDISHPSRVPRPKLHNSKIPLDQAVIVTLYIDMITTSDAVRNYPPRRRNCYASNERPLKYFKVYTQQNCKLECLTNYTLNKCGCSTVFMPKRNGTRLCNGKDYHCIYLAESEFSPKAPATVDMLNASMDDHLLKLRGDLSSTECDCLPICSKLNYNVQSSQLIWNWQNKYSNYSKGKHMSLFQIYFKDNQFITSERNELFGPIDFIANLGGLLGLFIGFSLLSLIEIIYYLTLRLGANCKLFGNKRWSGNLPE